MSKVTSKKKHILLKKREILCNVEFHYSIIRFRKKRQVVGTFVSKCIVSLGVLNTFMYVWVKKEMRRKKKKKRGRMNINLKRRKETGIG